MSNKTATLIFAIIMTVLSVSAIAWGFFRARKNNTLKGIGQRVLAVVLCLLLVVGTVANYACYAYYDLVGTVFSKSTASEEDVAKVTSASKNLVERIEAEAAVLLENKGNSLPLNLSDEKQANINVFGWSSIDPIYGGGGSGAGSGDMNVSFIQGLENAGFHVNKELSDFYESLGYVRENSTVIGVFSYDFNIYEADVDMYSDALLQNARDFSDVAVIFLSRFGGEDGELPMEMSEHGGTADRHYLELSAKERAMVDMVKAQGYKKVIAVINSAYAMELGFLDEEGIDAALWVGAPGCVGYNSVGKIFSGEINPSGRLPDTYAYDVTSSPAYYNAGAFTYTNAPYTMVGIMGPSTNEEGFRTFVDYQEGIYVGYRYYETRWIDNETGACDEAAYHAAVQYPFGYGTSYTEFKQEISNFTYDDSTITMDVTVTNTGSVPGKDVVQIYYTAPYTVGGLEKSHVVLGAFDKTEVLDPGASEKLTLTLNVEDMASYDYANEKCWVLDKGDYEIKLMNNAHDVIDSRTYTVDATVVYNENNKRASDKIAATNQFDDVTYGENLAYVSRADWEGTLPKERTKDRDASAELIKTLDDLTPANDPNDEEIIFANNGLTFADMQGAAYDDPRWERLLQQLSVEEMADLIGRAGYKTVEIPSIKKLESTEVEGPAGMNSFMNGIAGVAYPSEVMLAATWNVDLAKEMGECVGDECLVHGYDGIMAPAMNLHRTPFSGRNFEYYSEDGFLSGMMGAHVVQGYNSKGVNTFLKHFALNDQETNRIGVCVWANEQAMRELYFKPFELSVKLGGSQGIMSAFNRLGTTWCGASYPLLTTVLRGEWGFQGAVISDMAVMQYMSTDLAVRAGNDFMLTMTGNMPSKETTETTTGHQAMRNASYHILYALANSNAMEVANRQNANTLLYLIGGVDIALLAVAVLGFYGLTRKKKTAN